MTAPTTSPRAVSDPPERGIQWGPVAATLVVLGVAAAAWWIGRDLWFFSDDWNIFAGFHSGNLLEPFNGHLSLVPAGAYQALFHTLGVGEYWPYRMVGIVGYVVLGWQVFQFARVRIGDVPAVLATTAIVWSSAASTNVMFPFLVNYSLPIAAMVGAWRALDRESTRGDVVASLWLALALGTSGLGLMSAGAVAIELVLRRAPWQRWAILAPGPVLWFVWYVGHREATPITDELGTALSYAARMVLGGFTALAAGWKPGGVALAIASSILLIVVIVRWRSVGARTIGALGALAAFCATTALTRVDIVPPIPPDEIRYRWAVAAYLVLVAVTAWPALREQTDEASEPRVDPGLGIVIGTLVGGLLFVGAVRLVGAMDDWTDTAVSGKPGLRAVLFAVESVGRDADGSTVLPLSYVPVTAAAYLGAVADVGSPLDGTVVSTGGQPDQLRFADRYLISASGLTLSPGAFSPDCELLPPDGAIAPDSTLGVERVPGADSAIGIVRFGDEPVPLEAPVGTSSVELPTDRMGMDSADVVYRVSAPAGVTLFGC